jgi:23S rRNA-/tRNA-specific pseudouridylate synthase
VKQERGVIKSRLTTVDEDTPHARMTMSASGQGKTAITHFGVERRFGPVATLLNIKIDTGRMHQIRIHMQSQGHPIWGDGRYGDFKFNKKIAKAPFSLKRQFLHASSSTFPHPIHNRTITITATLPDDLTHVLQVLAERWQMG